MKKIGLISIGLSLLLLCSGCQEDKKKAIDQQGDFRFGLSIANSPDGSYLNLSREAQSENHHVVYFYDKEADKMVPLCQKANCEHKDMTCPAYQLGKLEKGDQEYALFSMIYNQDRLYLSYIGITGNAPVLVESVAKDGSDLRKEYESSDLGLINSFAMYQDKIIISKGFFDKDEAGNLLGSSTINTIELYDPVTKEVLTIANQEKKENHMVYPIGMEDKMLYYLDLDMDTNISQIKKYDIEERKESKGSECEAPTSIAYQGQLYSLKDKKAIVKQDLKTGKSTTLLELEEEGDLFTVSPQGFLTYSVYLDNGEYKTQVLDLDTEKPVFKEMKKNSYVIGRNQEFYFIEDQDHHIYKYDETTDKMQTLLE